MVVTLCFSQYIAIFCSFLLGFGDSCFNTQIYNIIGQRYSENSAPAMALFKFMQVCILCFTIIDIY